MPPSARKWARSRAPLRTQRCTTLKRCARCAHCVGRRSIAFRCTVCTGLLALQRPEQSQWGSIDGRSNAAFLADKKLGRRARTQRSNNAASSAPRRILGLAHEGGSLEFITASKLRTRGACRSFNRPRCIGSVEWYACVACWRTRGRDYNHADLNARCRSQAADD